MQFLGNRFVSLSSKFKIILLSVSEKAFKLVKTGFFSNLTYGIDHLIQIENYILCLPCSPPQESSNLRQLVRCLSKPKCSLCLLVAFFRLTKVLSFCNGFLGLQRFLP